MFVSLKDLNVVKNKSSVFLYMTPYKGASLCNSNLDKEAILLAKGSRINPFPLPQHAPTPLIRQRMLNAHNRQKAVGSTKPTSATPGVNKESRKPTLC